LVDHYSPEAIRRIKDSGGDIYVSGSGTLVRALMADGLLDELHLFVYPVTRGAGPRLFAESAPRRWSLTRSETYDNGVLYLAYQPVS
jgi:dihydrofolate reductase